MDRSLNWKKGTLYLILINTKSAEPQGVIMKQEQRTLEAEQTSLCVCVQHFRLAEAEVCRNKRRSPDVSPCAQGQSTLEGLKHGDLCCTHLALELTAPPPLLLYFLGSLRLILVLSLVPLPPSQKPPLCLPTKMT